MYKKKITKSCECEVPWSCTFKCTDPMFCSSCLTLLLFLLKEAFMRYRYTSRASSYVYIYIYIYTHSKNLEVNLFACAYRLFHRDFSPIKQCNKC